MLAEYPITIVKIQKGAVTIQTPGGRQVVLGQGSVFTVKVEAD